MAEYLIEDTTLTSLGNSIRGLNDTTATLTPAQMKSTVDDAVSEVEEQTDLIAQCLSALEGKVGGSGGSAVETCTVTVSAVRNGNTFGDAEFTDKNFQLMGHALICNTINTFEVLKNSLISIYAEGLLFDYEVTGEVYDYIVADGILVCEVIGDGTITLTES